MRQIAGACGIAETLVYRYYPTKALLLDAVVEYGTERLAAVHEAMRAAIQRAEGLRHLLVSCGTVYLYHVEGFSVGYALWSQRLPVAPERQARLGQAEQAIVADLAVALRRFADWRDAYAAAENFIGAIRGHVMLQDRIVRRPESPTTRSVFLEELAGLIAAGRLDR